MTDVMQTIPQDYFLILSIILFSIGVLGVILHHRNIISLLMSIEVILLSANLNFVTFSNTLQDLTGQVFSIFVLTVAAAEAAIGLAILVIYFRSQKTADVDDMTRLKG